MLRRGWPLAPWTLTLASCLLFGVLAAWTQAEEPVSEKPAGELIRQAPNLDVETIRERYADGQVKVEREVIQDSNDNYLNHGAWTMFDQQGRKIAEGRYENGARQGLWTRWLFPREAALLSQVPYREFPGPFISQAKFESGQIDGQWTIYDSRGRKISQWSYTNGERDGNWTWWYPNGKKLRELNYWNGDIVGTMRIWNDSGKLVSNVMFEEGRQLAPRTDWYDARQKKSEGTYLLAHRVPETTDDWWESKLAKVTVIGKDEKHGPWRSWYKHGQLRMEGAYEHGLETGKFAWFHPNGQKSTDGEYDEGRKTGEWTWWHAKGQKASQGQYADGAQTGKWVFWDAKGKVTQRADFTGADIRVVETPRSEINLRPTPSMNSNAEASRPSSPDRPRDKDTIRR